MVAVVSIPAAPHEISKLMGYVRSVRRRQKRQTIRGSVSVRLRRPVLAVPILLFHGGLIGRTASPRFQLFHDDWLCSGMAEAFGGLYFCLSEPPLHIVIGHLASLTDTTDPE
jgi:hypothetical protein